MGFVVSLLLAIVAGACAPLWANLALSCLWALFITFCVLPLKRGIDREGAVVYHPPILDDLCADEESAKPILWGGILTMLFYLALQWGAFFIFQ